MSAVYLRGLPFRSSLLYIFIAYYMQKGRKGVQIACKIAYVLNGRPLKNESLCVLILWINNPR